MKDSVNQYLEAAKEEIGRKLKIELEKHTEEIIEGIVVAELLQWKFFLESRGTGELQLVIRDNREPPQNK